VNKMRAGNCTGTSKNDRLVGGARANVIHAAGGNNRVYGNGGEDWLKGGTGQDVLYGDEDNDTGSRTIWARTRSSGAAETGAPGYEILRGGTADKTNDGRRDVIDCGENAGEDETNPDNDTDIYSPGVGEINNCENPNPPELEQRACPARGAKEGLARGGWGERASPPDQDYTPGRPAKRMTFYVVREAVRRGSCVGGGTRTPTPLSGTRPST
jgi:hypothetical protein